MRNKAVIDQVVKKVEKLYSGRQVELFAAFLKHYFSNACDEDILSRDVFELYTLAMSHWSLINKQSRQELSIEVFNPQHENWQSNHTVIQIVCPDMPFLVDSIRLCLNHQKIDISWILHTGGIRFLYEGDQPVQILPFASHDGGSFVLAPVSVEVERIEDEAALAQLKLKLEMALSDTMLAVQDWKKMLSSLNQAIDTMAHATSVSQMPSSSESQAFLRWLMNNHFTFLGYREYKVVGEGNDQALQIIEGSGLGVLRESETSLVFRQISHMPPQVQHMLSCNDQLIIISKTNTRSTVHRAAYTDCIDVKIFNEHGALDKVIRIIGLYTSSVYNSTDLSEIPLFRQKVEAILSRSGLPRHSHAGKDLLHILATLPRDELFHASVEALFDLSMGVFQLQGRRRVRLFIREDSFKRYFSCLVFLPRDIFNTAIINRFKLYLMKALNGQESEYNTHFSDSVLARIHFTIRVDDKIEHAYDLKHIENQLTLLAKKWQDDLKDQVAAYFNPQQAKKVLSKYTGFPLSYQEDFSSTKTAVLDIDHMERLGEGNPLEMRFYRPDHGDENSICLKLFHKDHAFLLSDALPMLKNMGLSMVGEHPYAIKLSDDSTIWINDYHMRSTCIADFDLTEIKHFFQEIFTKVWMNEVANDEFNALVLGAQMSWRQIVMFRAYANYLKQIGFAMDPVFIAQTLCKYPKIAGLLWKLFDQRFNPSLSSDRPHEMKLTKRAIFQLLNEVEDLDQDKVLRRYLNVIEATLRTNFFTKDADGCAKKYLSLKIHSQQVLEMPAPSPRIEIFVFSAGFEGIHIRMNCSNIASPLTEKTIARGGIRWSTRQDYRQEVLGLAKAQRVKNAGAGIVPTGAKGGYTLKSMTDDWPRDKLLDEGVRCYQLFISGLLDLVDNVRDGVVIKPSDVICYDPDDTYLVVAADKGTATFSNIANNLAISRGFWLRDAFASGGETGYDHKKMGITARGAWVSVEHHFKQLGVDVSKESISVVGIGDMAGDVFGNGMLMTPHLALKAAFNHMHIFLDPNPDLGKSFSERSRLFKLSRSTWQDYDASILSPGGGIYSRRAKSIPIHDAVKAWLGIEEDTLSPNQLIKKILTAPADLLWNGGIGTYVKASTETHEVVKDRVNNLTRVNACDLRAKVIGEGGNLGLTPLARIEYELEAGGLINTDFIDNAGGVDCSDREVNCKILLNQLVDNGKISLPERNQILSDMQREVAELVLSNNYKQNAALTFVSNEADHYLDLYCRLLDQEESEGAINRELEFLPVQKVINDRRIQGKAFTRSELAILMSYNKIKISECIKSMNVLHDTCYQSFLIMALPDYLNKKFPKEVLAHPLATNIIATQLSSQLVSDMGFSFVYQIQDETGASVEMVIKSYMAASRIFGMDKMLKSIKQLDYKVDSQVQYQMRKILVGLIRRASRWLIMNEVDLSNISLVVSHFKPRMDELYARLPKLLFGNDKALYENQQLSFQSAGVPAHVSRRIASYTVMYHMFNVIHAIENQDIEPYRGAKIYFMLLERLDLLWFRHHMNQFPSDTRWSVLAKASFKSDLDDIQQWLTRSVIVYKSDSKSILGRVNAWFEAYEEKFGRWRVMLSEMHSSGSTDFSILSVAIRELKKVLLDIEAVIDK